MKATNFTKLYGNLIIRVMYFSHFIFLLFQQKLRYQKDAKAYNSNTWHLFVENPYFIFFYQMR